MRWAPWACGLACSAAMLAAQAAPGPPDATASTNARGMEGLYRLDAPRGRVPGAVTLQLSSSGARAYGLSAPGDSDTTFDSRLHVVWNPLQDLQLGVGLSYITNTYVNVFRLASYRLGSPTLRVKYGRAVGRAWSLGVAAGALLPTAVERPTLDVRSRAIDGALLATWAVLPRLQLTANLAYTNDRSRLLSAVPPTPDRRLALNQYAGDHAAWGLGGQLHVGPMRHASLAAFAELGGELAIDRGLVPAPPRVAAGARLFAGRKTPIEVSLGGDLWLAYPSPRATALMPPALPWRAFAQLAVHFDGGPAAPTAAPPVAPAPVLMSSASSCTWDLDCRPGYACHEGDCQRIGRAASLEVKAKPPPMYVVTGLVVDASDRTPLRDAYVEIKSYPGTRLRVDPRAGTFRSWSVPVEESLDMTAFASGFASRRTVVSPFEGRPVVRVTFALRPDPKDLPITVRGLLRDRIWGSAVRGTAVALTAGKQVRSDAMGIFEMHLPAGRHEIVIAAPGYAAQRKQLSGEPGETIVINADLEPFSRRQTLP